MNDETGREPHPEDWTDVGGAQVLIGGSRQLVYDLVNRGALTRYYAGAAAIYWVAACRELGAARAKLRG